MRSINFSKLKSSLTGWNAAAYLLTEYLRSPEKADGLLDALPFPDGSSARAQAQSLFLGAIRQGHRTRSTLHNFLKKTPRPEVQAIFLIAGHELFNSPPEKKPKIVHHAVERAKESLSKPEANLINAVLRKLPEAFESIDQENLAQYYSHPNWLVKQWTDQFGRKDTEALLRWNQEIPPIHVKIPSANIPDELIPTKWQGFYKLPTGKIPQSVHALLQSGQAYIKDPSTRIAPQLLAVKPGDTVLDLCAAPGGKAFEMAQAMQGCGQITAVDLPSSRMDRLQANLSHLASNTLTTKIIQSDVLTLDRELLPDLFDAVMLDTPCSNTGVIQRRTDVKWRLTRDDISHCTHLQSQLLHSAARFVKKGGRLVYSTCSIEQVENKNIIEHFLDSRSGEAFSLEKSVQSYPWDSGHDGAGATLLVRNTD